MLAGCRPQNDEIEDAKGCARDGYACLRNSLLQLTIGHWIMHAVYTAVRLPNSGTLSSSVLYRCRKLSARVSVFHSDSRPNIS